MPDQQVTLAVTNGVLLGLMFGSVAMLIDYRYSNVQEPSLWLIAFMSIGTLIIAKAAYDSVYNYES